MKCAVYYSNSDLRIEERPVPPVGEGDILIKIMASGLCGSDLMEWYRIKRAPLVLGHEIAGEVVAVGDEVDRFAVGDRVFATHHVPCNACRACLSGHETACPALQKVNNFDPGGFAQFVRVGGESVRTGTLELPAGLSYEQGSFVEPLGTVVRALRTIALEPAQSVCVFGSGIAGALMIKTARALGAGAIVATDMSELRLKKAREFGADHAVKADRDIPAFIREVNEGRLADQVIICTGAIGAAHAALASVAPGGTVLFFAVPKPGETIPIDFNPYWRNDIALRTCYGAAPRDNVQALELLSHGTVTVTDMVTHRFGLDEIGRAFAVGAQPDTCLKVIIEPNR
jgi:L-iditol 2-dehydrogenase